MPRLADVVAVLDDHYPPALAEPWDAVGLVCGDPDAEVRSVLFAVDPVAAVVDEAIERGVDLLVTHHPLFLRPVHRVAATTFKGRVVHRLIAAGIALHTAHTNADAANPGVSDALADLLGLQITGPLLPTGGGTPISTAASTTGTAIGTATGTATGTAAGATTDAAISTATETMADTATGVTAAMAAGVAPGAAAAGSEPDAATGSPSGAATGAVAGSTADAATGAGTSALGSGVSSHADVPVGDASVAEAAPVEAARAGATPTGVSPTGDSATGTSPTGDSATGAGRATGIGRVGELAEAVTLEEFARRVAAVLPATAGGIRVAGDPRRMVRRVAVCGGAGDSLFDAVRAAGVDAYLTADLRHHAASEALEAGTGTGRGADRGAGAGRDTGTGTDLNTGRDAGTGRGVGRDAGTGTGSGAIGGRQGDGAAGGPALIDAAHWATEWPWLARAAAALADGLARRGTTVETYVSTTPTDPWTSRLGPDHA